MISLVGYSAGLGPHKNWLFCQFQGFCVFECSLYHFSETQKLDKIKFANVLEFWGEKESFPVQESINVLMGNMLAEGEADPTQLDFPRSSLCQFFLQLSRQHVKCLLCFLWTFQFLLLSINWSGNNKNLVLAKMALYENEQEVVISKMTLLFPLLLFEFLSLS